MIGKEPLGLGLSRDVDERPLERPRPLMAHVRETSRPRTIVPPNVWKKPGVTMRSAASITFVARAVGR